MTGQEIMQMWHDQQAGQGIALELGEEFVGLWQTFAHPTGSRQYDDLLRLNDRLSLAKFALDLERGLVLRCEFPREEVNGEILTELRVALKRAQAAFQHQPRPAPRETSPAAISWSWLEESGWLVEQAGGNWVVHPQDDPTCRIHLGAEGADLVFRLSLICAPSDPRCAGGLFAWLLVLGHWLHLVKGILREDGSAGLGVRLPGHLATQGVVLQALEALRAGTSLEKECQAACDPQVAAHFLALVAK